MGENGFILVREPEPKDGDCIKAKLKDSSDFVRKKFGNIIDRNVFDVALEYIEQLESAQPKWISVTDNPPDEGDVVFVHDPDEGWIALVKVIQVNLASIDVKAIWPEHSPPFIAKVWTPLRLPEPPKEET